MKEYIERAVAIEAIQKYQYPYGVQFLLSNIPAADVAPVRYGRWERRNMGLWDEDYAYVCSACGEVWTLIDSTPEDNNMNYCPNCGALMDGKEDGHV